MITFGNNSYIFNTYSAAGEKLMTQYQFQMLPIQAPLSGNGETMETVGMSESGGLRSGPATPIDTNHKYYCGNVVYDQGVTRLLTDEGYVTFSETGAPVYHYYLRDHLGNIRVVMGQTGTVEQVNHYYAFGGLMRESTNPGLQPYKYGGKELDRYAGLDAYDFGARSYFADRMQWSTMDPLCEKYYDLSPYGYCANNPVKYFDPDGKSIWTKGIKLAWKVVKAVKKNGLKALNTAETYTSAFTDVKESFQTLTDDNAPLSERLMAGGQLVSELGPISYKEGKNIIGYFKKARPSNKLQESSKIGLEAHRQIEKELVDNYGGQNEVKMTLKDKTIVRKDHVKPDGTCIIIKPDTPSGHKSAKKENSLCIEMENEQKQYFMILMIKDI